MVTKNDCNSISNITKHNLGPAFNKLLSLLCDLEAAHKWVNKTRGFAKVSVDCPAQLTLWVRDGRGWSSPPVVKDISKFQGVWWAWWIALQPSWCPKE